MTSKLFCFRVNEDKTIDNISYEDYIALDPVGNKLNWDSYKEQLSRPEGSVNVEYFEDARYISIKDHEKMYYFGMGLSKELLKRLNGVNDEPVKAIILYKDKTYRQISKEELYNIVDKDDIPALNSIYKYNSQLQQFGTLNNDKILWIFVGTLVNTTMMDKIVDNDEIFNRFVQAEQQGSEHAQNNLNKYGNANYIKRGWLDKLHDKIAVAIGKKALKKLTPPNFIDYSEADKEKYTELITELCEILTKLQKINTDSQDGMETIPEYEARINQIGEEISKIATKYGDDVHIGIGRN